MVARGNKDQHNYNYGYVRGVKVQEQEKWGRATAARRYGELKQTDMKPPDHSQPQDRVDQHGPGYSNDVPENSWLRGGGRGGEGKPGFDLLREGKEPRRPKAERSADPGSGDIHGWAHDGAGSPFSKAGKR